MTEHDTQAPEELRRDIERTRGELGATVAALSRKTDVKKRLTRKVEERREALPGGAKNAAGQIAHTAEERPFPAIATAFGAGVALGFLIGKR